MHEKTQTIIGLIKEADLDQTIKDILIRDLEKEGLTDFLKEQIKAYCLEGIKQLSKMEEEARKILEAEGQQNPGQ